MLPFCFTNYIGRYCTLNIPTIASTTPLHPLHSMASRNTDTKSQGFKTLPVGPRPTEWPALRPPLSSKCPDGKLTLWVESNAEIT